MRIKNQPQSTLSKHRAHREKTKKNKFRQGTLIEQVYIEFQQQNIRNTRIFFLVNTVKHLTRIIQVKINLFSSKIFFLFANFALLCGMPDRMVAVSFFKKFSGKI